ncbi:MAG: alpha/beta fold hydrolase [Thermoleophilia bacterium]
MSKRRKRLRHRHPIIKVLKIFGLALLGLLLFLLVTALFPLSTGDLKSHPDPAGTYEEATRRIQAITDEENGRVCDVCGTRFYTHGSKTPKVVVLVHGLTNSPRQFEELGQQLFNDGYNVLIPRMPYHGLKTHTVSELGNTTPEDLSRFADDTADIATGLGDEVTVAGLSGGGTITGWITQNRSDIDKTVLIAPLYGMSGVPPFANTMAGNLFARLPDFDFSSSSEPPRDSVYLGWSTRGVAEYLVLSRVSRPDGNNSPAGVRNITVVTNGNDHTVNNGMTQDVAAAWESTGAKITRYEFAQDLGLPHDYIDITAIGDKGVWIYPILKNLIESS